MAPEGLKGMFTKEIQDTLLDGGIDAAVHSLKDLPGRTPAGVEVVAVLERAKTRDVLISKNARTLADLPAGARVGTSSVRREKQLHSLRPDLAIAEIRGNVPTRLRKLCESNRNCDRDRGGLDAIVLAQAGLERLGYSVERGQLLFEGVTLGVEILDSLLPAVGQGAIALEARSDDGRAREILASINHGPTFACIRAERELLRLLNGDCNLPVGVETALDAGGTRLRMKALVFTEDGERPRTGEVTGDAGAPETLASHLFRELDRPIVSSPSDAARGEQRPA